MNTLETMMNTQKAFQERLGTNFDIMSYKDRRDYMMSHAIYLDQEIQEALYEMPFFKEWKNYDAMTNEEMEEAWAKVRMELIDSFHFFMNLMLCAGMSADDVFKMYMAKNKENHRRQDVGYTADVSYQDQSVEEVMHAEPTCTVIMDDKVIGSSTFVAILEHGEGTSVTWNATLLQLVGALQGLFDTVKDHLPTLSVDERNEVLKALDEMEASLNE